MLLVNNSHLVKMLNTECIEMKRCSYGIYQQGQTTVLSLVVCVILLTIPNYSLVYNYYYY